MAANVGIKAAAPTMADNKFFVFLCFETYTNPSTPDNILVLILFFEHNSDNIFASSLLPITAKAGLYFFI